MLGTTALRRRMVVSLEISNKDRSYEWFLAWMTHQANMASKTKLVSRLAPWTRSHQLSVETVVEQRKNGSSSALFKLVAGPGTHYFKYQGAWMQVSPCNYSYVDSNLLYFFRLNVNERPDPCNSCPVFLGKQ